MKNMYAFLTYKIKIIDTQAWNIFVIKEYEVSDYLRMSGLYWSLTFLDLSNSIEKLDKAEIVEFLKRNQHESGGFSPCDGHDPHLLYSLSALQVNKSIDYA